MIVYIEDQKTFDKAIELWFKNEIFIKTHGLRLNENETLEKVQSKLIETYANKKGIKINYTSDGKINYDLLVESAQSVLSNEFIKQGFPMILYADVIGNRFHFHREIILEGSSVDDAKSIHYPHLN